MTNNPIELSFPCPACGIRLTILQASADGPCPHCHIPIQIELKSSLRRVEILPKRETFSEKNNFDRRRFRPASQAVKAHSNLRLHPSKL